MRVLRSGANVKWIFGVASLVLTGAVWISFFRTPPESWQLLAKSKLIKIEAEQAIYEKPDSPDYYLRVRITNLSSQVVGFDKFFDVRCLLNQGTSLPMQNGLFPICLFEDEKLLGQSAVAKFQSGRLPQVAPKAIQEIFIVVPNGKSQIARSWNNYSLWWKSHIFFPENNRLSPFLIVSINGRLTATNGKNTESFLFGGGMPLTPTPLPLGKNSLILKFPVQTKTLP